MTERLHFHFSLSCIGEGNGNPLQCSCLENPRDRGAWWAAVYGVAQSRTWLKWLSSSSSNLFTAVELGRSQDRFQVWHFELSLVRQKFWKEIHQHFDNDLFGWCSSITYVFPLWFSNCFPLYDILIYNKIDLVVEWKITGSISFLLVQCLKAPQASGLLLFSQGS